MGLRWAATLIVGSSVAFSILFVNLILASSLEEKDMAEAKRNAVVQARLIKSGLLNTMISTGDYAAIEITIKNLQKDQNFEFRMVRAPHVIRQHGMRRGESPKDHYEADALNDGKVKEVMDDRTTLRMIFPFVTDSRCAKCHLDMDDKPVRPGMVNGLAVLTFDLTSSRDMSMAIILKIMLFMTAIMLLSGLAIMFFANRFVINPMQSIASAVHNLSLENFNIRLPHFEAKEIEVVAQTIRETAEDLALKKKERLEMIERQKRRSEEVASLIRRKATDMGFDEDADFEGLVGDLVHVMDEAQRGALIQKVVKYLDQTGNKLSIPPDPELIPAVSVYLVSQLEGVAGKVKRRSIELALDEALNNSLFHGVLQLKSPKDNNSVEKFPEIVSKRRNTAPYSLKKTSISSLSDKKRATFIIADDGPGFDWRTALKKRETEKDRIFGRGLLLMRALSSKMEYNESGNQLTLVFDLGKSDNQE